MRPVQSGKLWRHPTGARLVGEADAIRNESVIHRRIRWVGSKGRHALGQGSLKGGTPSQARVLQGWQTPVWGFQGAAKAPLGEVRRAARCITSLLAFFSPSRRLKVCAACWPCFLRTEGPRRGAFPNGKWTAMDKRRKLAVTATFRGTEQKFCAILF